MVPRLELPFAGQGGRGFRARAATPDLCPESRPWAPRHPGGPQEVSVARSHGKPASAPSSVVPGDPPTLVKSHEQPAASVERNLAQVVSPSHPMPPNSGGDALHGDAKPRMGWDIRGGVSAKGRRSRLAEVRRLAVERMLEEGRKPSEISHESGASENACGSGRGRLAERRRRKRPPASRSPTRTKPNNPQSQTDGPRSRSNRSTATSRSACRTTISCFQPPMIAA